MLVRLAPIESMTINLGSCVDQWESCVIRVNTFTAEHRKVSVSVIHLIISILVEKDGMRGLCTIVGYTLTLDCSV
jgi:hypothetical protein